MPRDTVLRAVSGALAGVEVPVLPRVPATAPIADDLQALATRFAAAARAVGTVVHEVADTAAAAHVLRDVLARTAAKRVVVAPSALARAVTAAAAAPLAVTVDVVDAAPPAAVVAAADVGVTEADVLVAASGTLVLRAAACPRSVSLLPAMHVAVVPRSRLVADLGRALALVAGAPPDTCVTLITGPSRTADIEKKLVVGVHGPCTLHVVLVDDIGA